MSCKSLSNPQKWILKGIPALFIIGTLTHFAYTISGENPIVGLFAPVNESIWEHSKMVLLPVILWWSIYYFLNGKQYNINKNKWFGSGLISLITALIVIPLFYYFYTQAFGVELLWVDISILFIAILLGQLLASHFYKYSEGINANIVIIIFIAIILLFILFTFYPPQIPMFQDGITGKYGI